MLPDESIDDFLKRRDAEVLRMKVDRKMRKSSVSAKAKKAGSLGARRSLKIKRLIALDAKIDKLRSQYRAIESQIASIDMAINSLGFRGDN